MRPKEQGQHAGDNSSQFQVAGDVVLVQGITEERTREIVREMHAEAVEALVRESQKTASGRIDKFDVEMLRRLSAAGLLGAFAEPAFQVSVKKAQLGAASTDREDDYELLAALIEDRAKRVNQRPVKASINRAIEVVDEIDEDAMRGLTVLAAVRYRPRGRNLSEVLLIMNSLLDQLIAGPLPHGDDWLEQLDLLGAIRISSGQRLKPLDDYWSSLMPGFISSGIAETDETLPIKMAKMGESRISLSPIPHALKPGFLQLPLANSLQLEVLLGVAGVTGEEADRIREVVTDDFSAFERDDGLIPAFREVLKTYTYLWIVHEWWSQLPSLCVVTPVGNVLARANSNRLDRLGLLPPTD